MSQFDGAIGDSDESVTMASELGKMTNIKVKQDKIDEAKAFFSQLATDTLANESGTLQYIVHQRKDDPTPLGPRCPLEYIIASVSKILTKKHPVRGPKHLCLLKN